MKIIFDINRELVVLEVDLLDNTFTQKWKEIFVPEFNFEANIIHEIKKFTRHNYDVCDQQLAEVHKSLYILEKHNLVYNGYVPEKFSQCTQPILNNLHRFFTHTTDFNHKTNWGCSNFNQIAECLDSINECVHNIEIYLDTPIKQMYKETNIEHEELIITKPGCEQTDRRLVLSNTDRSYHTVEHFDVILSSEILGKSVYRSYIDQDDPTDWDTSGHYATTGGLHILFNPKSRQRVYESKHFKRWCKHHRVKFPMCDFPLGTVKNKKDLIYVVEKLKKNTTNYCNVIYQH